MKLHELFEYDMRPPKEKMIDAALAALHRRAQSKGDLQDIGGYAFDIARSYPLGISARELTKLYLAKHGLKSGQMLEAALESICWDGYEKVPGKKDYEKGSCRKKR